jgi:uncharacterized protein YciI
MTMKYFFCKLIPPRPTFVLDMTDAEKAIMRDHVAYWQTLMAKGQALAFGPVADPKGGYGIGIIGVENDADIDAIRRGDPTVKANHGFAFEAFPMLQLVMRS